MYHGPFPVCTECGSGSGSISYSVLRVPRATDHAGMARGPSWDLESAHWSLSKSVQPSSPDRLGDLAGPAGGQGRRVQESFCFLLGEGCGVFRRRRDSGNLIFQKRKLSLTDSGGLIAEPPGWCRGPGLWAPSPAGEASGLPCGE